jgi:hypothetical protein
MSLSSAVTAEQSEGNSLYAALARTATRSMALYFSRPVRLFRPAKVSGWQTIKSMAARDGVTALNPTYLGSMVKNHGFMVIPKHFVPPILINAALGTILWTSYAGSYTRIEEQLPDHPTATAALSGAIAGAAQAALAAPAENVRIVLEGEGGHCWSYAWKEVFLGTSSVPNASKEQQLKEVRQVRTWMREVGEMAGRGWDGWGWGVTKDIFAFAAFFAIFDITRRVALRAKILINQRLPATRSVNGAQQSLRSNTVAGGVVHGGILVTGGVFAGLAYEIASRPFDNARKLVQQARLESNSKRISTNFKPIFVKVVADGLTPFFRNPHIQAQTSDAARSSSKRLQTALRTLARVGPWGVGFLAWEIFGAPGMPQDS